MTKHIFFFLIISLLVCCKSFKEEDAKQLVTTFITEIKLQNHLEAINLYPTFKELDNYITIYDFEVTNVLEQSDYFKVYVGAKSSNQDIDLLFWVKEENDKLIIESSKGLTPQFYSKMFEYGKKTGCVTANDISDTQIQEKCKQAKKVFENNKAVLQAIISNSIEIINNTSKDFYNYINGSITLVNNSDYNIPSSSYEVTLDLLNNNDEIVKTETIYFPKNIRKNSRVSSDVIQTGNNLMTSSSVNFKITNDAFIENIIYNMKYTGNECNSITKKTYNNRKASQKINDEGNTDNFLSKFQKMEDTLEDLFECEEAENLDCILSKYSYPLYTYFNFSNLSRQDLKEVYNSSFDKLEYHKLKVDSIKPQMVASNIDFDPNTNHSIRLKGEVFGTFIFKTKGSQKNNKKKIHDVYYFDDRGFIISMSNSE